MKTAQSQAEQQQQQQVETGDVAEAQQSHDEALQELQELLLQVSALIPQPWSAASLSSASETRPSHVNCLHSSLSHTKDC